MSERVESDNCSLSAKRITYFMTGLNLVSRYFYKKENKNRTCSQVSGVINFILGVWKVESLLIVGGIISTFGGAILLTGIIKVIFIYIVLY